MADIILPGPSFSEIHIAEQKFCTLIANTSPAAGGGIENGLIIMFEQNPGWLISTNCWLGARGRLDISRMDADGLAADHIAISENEPTPYATFGIGLNQTAVSRFAADSEVAVGAFPGDRLTLLKSGVGNALSNLQAPNTAKVELIVGTTRYDIGRDRIYLSSRPELKEPFETMCYLGTHKGLPYFRFSNATLIVIEDQLRVVIHRHQKLDHRSLDPRAVGYLSIPSNHQRSIVIYDQQAEYSGTVLVTRDNGRDVASFTNGDLNWKVGN